LDAFELRPREFQVLFGSLGIGVHDGSLRLSGSYLKSAQRFAAHPARGQNVPTARRAASRKESRGSGGPANGRASGAAAELGGRSVAVSSFFQNAFEAETFDQR